MITLYIETNFFIGFAKSQDKDSEKLVNNISPDRNTLIKIVTLSVCCMESLSVLNDEISISNRFQNNLDFERNKLKGDKNSPYSQEIQRYLEQAKIKNKARLNYINNRLFQVLEWATKNVELIQLKPDILSASLQQILITDQTDNLILHCILDHARTHQNTYPNGKKILLTENSRDFGTKEIKEILQGVGIKYLTSTEKFLGWLQSKNIEAYNSIQPTFG
ncbi:conserved hypothetical protein [Trichormus variabilis ATCC 29413]|uniref:DUF4935 domain-containing protein n=2 Tax=Anabaena variabilis TaxID=264691 RepID=Q3M8Q2_TRIV2|nr:MULTISPECIES: PIN domain-containing protein [Nostocaceae]ABA22634.1 conserved hypothetical protein [Trichormus variabilis ATCC 29413]MBC1214386.1 DUF4935 domain-containing protein [Trichormus variabilis ARAD]MBC1258749.1 DUF4935 domain-containing protein [Trichormus variabilis V5]MBC1265499.1 DUF4935 domain-containing protein [Trichormus variabilis FSR]MBC1303046.1 DUF4935 domain-containing protein [Trichormus variabilis N2B]